MNSFLTTGLFVFTMKIFGFVDNIDTLRAVILIAGILLLIIEMFMPGFGVAGGIGVALLILGIFLTAKTALDVLVMFLILAVFVAIVLTVVLRSAKKGKLAKKLILNVASHKELGYTTSKDLSGLVGKTGKAITTLRPAGTGDFEGIRLDIVTDGGYIEKDAEIKIISVNGSRIVVAPVEKQ